MNKIDGVSKIVIAIIVYLSTILLVDYFYITHYIDFSMPI